MPGQFRPRGVTMRDCSKNRAGFDRVLMAVAATFLTVSATSALAQADPARNSAAELAIDAAVPRPEPANVPPPTASDFKLDTTASVADAAKADASEAAADQTSRCRDSAGTPKRRKPGRCAARRAPLPSTTSAAMPRLPTAADARHGHGSPPPSRSRPPAALPPADQPVADRLRDLMASKGAALFRSQGRARRGREVLCRARLRAAVDRGRPLTAPPRP